MQVDESFRVSAGRWWNSKRLRISENTIVDYEWRLSYLRRFFGRYDLTESTYRSWTASVTSCASLLAPAYACWPLPDQARMTHLVEALPEATPVEADLTQACNVPDPTALGANVPAGRWHARPAAAQLAAGRDDRRAWSRTSMVAFGVDAALAFHREGVVGELVYDVQLL